jgi:gliding motility-associated-like protein
VNVTPAVSTITVNITPTITVNSGIICSGNTFTLIPGGASTYTYSGGSNTVNPMVTTNYSVTGTSALGCVGFNPAISTITVNATPTISVNSGTICFGGTFTLTPTGAATYTYSSGTATVSPSTTTSYSVSGTSLQGCPNLGLAVNTVTVRTLPVLVSTPTVSASNCITPTGAVNSVSVSGAATLTYSWTNSVPALVGTSNNLINQPAGNYTLTATDGFGCKNTFGPYVIPNLSAPAAPTASATSNSVCSGNTINLFANTAGTGISYTWTGPNSFSSSTQNPTLVSATLLNNGVYNVFATAAGCVSSTSQVTITVNTTPTVSVNSGVICTGNSFTMNPTGASTYTYSSGTNVVNPLINTTYSVTGTSVQGCISANTAISSVTANITPTISVNTGVICTGNSFTLIPSGAATYTYSSGSNIVNPLINTTYSVNGTSAQGCVNVTPAVSTITVNITPTITVNSGIICSGGALSLIPTGAATYTYFGGGAATVSPTITSTYSITGTSAEGCVSSNTVVSTVLVLPLPIITVNSGTICSGETFTMVPGGAATYTFSSGTDVVSPTSTTSYTVTGTNSDGCTNTVGAISVVTVNALPSLTVSASSSSICSGYSSTLSVIGATSYSWNSGANTTSISVTPSVSTTYSVSGTDILGCVNTSTQTVSLFVDPIINLTASSPTICAGLSANILASGVNSYTWSTGANTSSVNVSPIVNTTYSVNGTDVNGCSTYTTILLGVSPTPTVNALGSSIGICIGSSANLLASGATTYSWNTGESSASINVNPIINSTYTVVGTNGFGCSSTATVSLLAYSNPTVYIGTDIEVALGESYQFNPSQFGAVSYLWAGGDFLNSTTIINPVTTPLNDIVYVLTVTSIDGCVASDTISVKVLADLIIANYMSPNGDGVNDTWKLNVPLLIKNYSVDIIDSYNQKVFHADKNYNNDFDGKKNGENLPDGVYYYFIKDGSTLLYNGSITITR